ncbi:MAG: amidohydrolase [Reichenbachiella sp.]
MSDLKLAILQSELYWEDVEANLAMFEEQIWGLDEVDFIMLPEMFNTGFSMNPRRLAEVPGLKTQRWMLQMANQTKALVGGSYIVNDGGHYYNRFVAAYPDGSMQTYDKRHLFSLAKEEDFFSAGQSRLILAYKGWKICPLICYDLRFPNWARNSVDQGGSYDYDLLVYSANWPKQRIAAWDTLLKARAIENISFVAGANRIGQDGNDNEYVGHSAIYDYTGLELDKLDNKEGVVQTTLIKAQLEEFRTKFPFLKDRV